MKRIATMDVICAACGKLFTRTHGKFPKFCSVQCRPKTEIAERLSEKSRTAPSGCIEWTGAIISSGGYGELSVNGRPQRAHRLAYELKHGAIPRGLFVCHSCDNPRCINVDHLFLGTNADNMLDCKQKMRLPHGDRHPNSRFSDAQVLRMKRLYSDGASIADVARMFPGTPYTTVYHAVTGRNRKHLQGLSE